MERNITFVDRKTMLSSFYIIKQDSNSLNEKLVAFISKKNKKTLLKIDLIDLNKSLLKHFRVKLFILKTYNYNN